MQFLCVFEGIVKSFENVEYVKPPIRVLQVLPHECFSQWKGVAKPTHLMHVVHMGA
jgi:hypothetical protein